MILPFLPLLSQPASLISHIFRHTPVPMHPPACLDKLYRDALYNPLVAGISIATRPDCLPDDVLSVLAGLRYDFPGIRRGYPLSCFTRAVKDLQNIHIPVIVHVILGLPGESRSMMLETIAYLNGLHISGIKLQLLHVLKGTDLALDYKKGIFKTMTMEEYINILISCIENLSPETVIHRVTGGGPRELLLAPLWSTNKKKVLNTLHHYMKLQNSYQGKHWKGCISYAARTTDSL